MINTQPNCNDINESGLIHVDLAKKVILESMPVLQDIQQIPIEQAKGRCLAESIISPINVPAHTNSAVDGYAIHGLDIPAKNSETTLNIQDTVLAGQFLSTSCSANHCVRIMTGAAMPIV